MGRYLGAISDNVPWKTFATVLLVSLLARLILFGLMLGYVDTELMQKATPDVGNYFAAADAIRNHLNFHSDRVLIFGPGFPVFLALMQSITLDPRFIIIVQILIASLASALVADLAWQLTKRPDLALVAGLLHALSVTSLALSNILLSDTLYFGLLAGGLSLYLRGLQTGKLSYFMPAALLFGIGPLVRSVGLNFFGPLIFITLVWYWPIKGTSWKTVRSKLALPLACLLSGLIIVGGWMTRERTFQEPPLSYAVHAAEFKVTAKARSYINGTTYEHEKELLYRDLDSLRPLYHQSFYKPHMIVADREMAELAIGHPFALVVTVLTNAWENCNNNWNHLQNSFPPLRPKIDSVTRAMDRNWLQYRVTVLSAIGLIILWHQRKYRVAIILVMIAGYFGLMTGFTLDQGNRIFYPGMVGWSILCAVAIVEGFRKLLSITRAI